VLLVALLVCAAVGGVALVRPATPSGPAPVALQQALDDVLARDRSIRHAVLAVATGDGHFAWTGAAGQADGSGPSRMLPTTPFCIASVTKLYTATVVMRLVELGLLAIDDPIARYLPPALIADIASYRGVDQSGLITIRDLLAHRSGIADYYDSPGPDGKTLFERFVAEPQRRWTADETIARVRGTMAATAPPDTRTEYSDTNYQLLGKLIEQVAGKPLGAVYDEMIFRPLGFRSTWLMGSASPPAGSRDRVAAVFHGAQDIIGVRANGAFWADGGIVSTADEMVAFLRALRSGRLVRRDSLARMHSWQPMWFAFGYGLGTMRFRLPRPLDAVLGLPPLWGHSGSTGSFLYYDEDADLYLAGTVDQTQARRAPFTLMARAIAIAKARRSAADTAAAHG
jgi:CubicO group peptidase (beta-lactamase class C family)